MGKVIKENTVEVTTTLVAKAVSLWYLAAKTAVVTAAGRGDSHVENQRVISDNPAKVILQENFKPSNRPVAFQAKSAGLSYLIIDKYSTHLPRKKHMSWDRPLSRVVVLVFCPNQFNF